tara:strand:- start:2202 stop:2585 length:384 start_codon:yes stop_codon:yes gene_type:complete
MPYRKKIKDLRESLGISQRELASMIGMNASQLSLIESGKRDLRVGQLMKIAAALGITLGQLVNGIAPAAFSLRHNDLVMVKTDTGPQPYAVAESRGRVFLLPMFDGSPLDPDKAEIVSFERGGAAED